MKEQVHKLESKAKDDQACIARLEEKIEYLERNQAASKIEIKNIPKGNYETKTTLSELVLKTATVLDLPLQSHDIKDVFRVKEKADKSPKIVVDFVSVVTKDKMLNKVRQFNKNNKSDKLNTSHLKLGKERNPIYIAEHLTPKTQNIFYKARCAAKEKGFKFCWTANGKVFMRQEEGKPHFVINKEEDLNKVYLDK
ncbi:hypothetical protein O0L34_g18435 [Tuta absoluta]|nr:hypothetical protein O0L34_g18435 [Tuta absoluta]